MAPVTLPPSFFNSFWSADYRKGLEVLFRELDQGCVEVDDIAAFIDTQVLAHQQLAASLLTPPDPSTSSSQSTSLQIALLNLRGVSATRGEAHRALAQDLETQVLLGYQQWKLRHGERVKGARDEMLGKNGAVFVWEKEVGRLNSLKQAYLVKSRLADDSEDDAKFAPSPASNQRSPQSDPYTSPKAATHASPLRRTGTVADRISEKLRAASIDTSPKKSTSSRKQTSLVIEGKTLPPPPSPLRPASPSEEGGSSPTKEEAFIPPTSPDGRPTFPTSIETDVKSSLLPSASIDSPMTMSPMLLSGLSLTPASLGDILRRFDAYLLTSPALHSDEAFSSSSSTKSNAALATRKRSTILGAYEKTFSGEEVVEWLRENVEGFGGDWDRCVEAASELQKSGHLSRIGVGRGFEPSDDTYFILRQHPEKSPLLGLSSPLGLHSPLSPAASANIQSLVHKYLPSSLSTADEPVHVRLRKEAIRADEQYREGVKTAEARRLEMEERIERGLRMWERWERERLGVVREALKTYEKVLSRLPARLVDLNSPTALAIEAFNPDADFKALIEGNRTGPFRPVPHVYEGLEADVPDVSFGVDLRRWAGDAGWKSALHAPKREKGSVPSVLEGLLGGIKELGKDMPDDEKRKAWIYEVPLHELHSLRNSVNDPAMTAAEIKGATLKFNLPTVAGAIKLYLLELNPPVLGWEGWEDAKAIYPSVGADQERDMTSAVTSVLSRLPGAQLFVLNQVVAHFRALIDETRSDEPDDVYITKLALSTGRCFVRPQSETELTIHDRTASLFLTDLITLYSAVFPPLIEKKRAEADRVMPVRKRTALVDQRISRSRLGSEQDAQVLLERQHQLQNPPKQLSLSVPPVPLPKSEADLKTQSTAMSSSQPAPPPAAPHVPALVPAASAAPALAPALGLPAGIPTFAEPQDDDDDEETGPARGVNVVPPTPEISQREEEFFTPSAQIPDPIDTSPARSTGAPDDGDPGSATLSYLDSLEIKEDSPVSPTSAGLKRATSGEVSRMRGPRGARGPRPAPGRVPSHANHPSVSSVASAGAGEDVVTPRASMEIKRGPRAEPPTQTQTPGKRGSTVSAMAAQWENRQ